MKPICLPAVLHSGKKVENPDKTDTNKGTPNTELHTDSNLSLRSQGYPGAVRQNMNCEEI